MGGGGARARAEGVGLTASGDGIRTGAEWSLSSQRAALCTWGAPAHLAQGALAPSAGGCAAAVWLPGGALAPGWVPKAARAPSLGQGVQQGSVTESWESAVL